MTKTIKGNLELDKDTSYDESIVVEGHITCKNGFRFNLKVAGNISARDISAGNISAGDISAGNISAGDISASKNLNASFVVCESIKVKLKCIANKILTKRSSYERKEVKLEADK